MPTAAVIVPAAGRGTRMGEGPAKQYRLLGTRPVLWHTLARLQACARVGRIVVAIHAEDRQRFREVAGDTRFSKLSRRSSVVPRARSRCGPGCGPSPTRS